MPYLKRYRVRGTMHFPKDMLRYDGSRALGADDQASIDATYKDLQESFFQPRDIELIKIATNRTAAAWIADERWQSFGWQVVVSTRPTEFITPEVAKSWGFDMEHKHWIR